MSVLTMPPPRRFVVEIEDKDECSDHEIDIYVLVEVTGVKDLVYIVGMESPWLGVTIEEIEKYAKDGSYGQYTAKLMDQIARVKRGESI